jgi:hypothetical protein
MKAVERYQATPIIEVANLDGVIESIRYLDNKFLR